MTVMDANVPASPDQVSIGVLVDAVPRDAVDEAVAVCGVQEKRSDGKLPAHVTLYVTLGLCLFAEDDYEEVAAKVTGSLDRVITQPRVQALGEGFLPNGVGVDLGGHERMRAALATATTRTLGNADRLSPRPA